MTTGLQLALLAGALLGLGVVLMVARLLPAEPDLAEVLSRLTPTRARTTSIGPVTTATGKERIGVWAIKVLPPAMWIRTPTRELALLRIPLARFYGDKIVMALMGLVIPPLLAFFFATIGLGFPVAVPAIASLGLAVVMFFLPNYNAVDDARKARLEFARALGAYIDLVALERNNGSGVRQAMESAAEVGDSWVFTRLSEELTRSRWRRAAALRHHGPDEPGRLEVRRTTSPGRGSAPATGPVPVTTSGRVLRNYEWLARLPN